MFTLISKKTWIGIAVIVVLGVLGYVIFGSGPSITQIGQPQSEIVGQDILTLVNNLQSISIDQSIFTSPLFVNLKDHQSSLYPESQGRPNPFLNFGSDSGVSATQKTTSKATSTKQN